MRLRAVLFDAAGTLIRVAEPVGVTYTRIARDHGVVAAADRVDAAFRSVMRGMPPMVFPDASPNDCATLERAWWSEVVHRVFTAATPTQSFEHFDAFFGVVFAHFADATAWQVVDDARATIAEVRQRGLKTGMVSNFDHRLPALLDGLGLSALLDVVMRPSAIGAAKPDARIFHAALDHLDIAPADALYIGDDDIEDVAGATGAGLQALNVASLASFAALLEYIDRSS